MKTFEHIVDIIAALILLFLFPLLFFGQKQDALTQSYVKSEVTEFVDDVRGKGYISKDMYDHFNYELSESGVVYDISMEHKHLNCEPEYRFRTVDEIIDDQNGSYTGTNEYTYRPISTQQPVVTDPINDNGLPMNTETNESVLAGAHNNPASPDHVHTDACYIGHKHSGADGRYFIHNHQHTSACTKYTQLIRYQYVCGSCHSVYYYNRAIYGWDNVTKSPYIISTINDPAICPVCNSTSVTSSQAQYGYGYSCSYSIDRNGDGLNDDVGTSTSYQYKMPAPQNSNKVISNTGCYTYHQHGYIKNYPEGQSYLRANYIYSGAEDYDVLGGIINASGVKNLCYVPKYYSIGWVHEDNSDQYYKVTYELQVQADGTERFIFSSAYMYGYNAANYTFPQSFTLQEFNQLRNSSYAENFWETIGRWTFTNFSKYKLFVEGSGSIDLCNETKANQWYLSCGKVEDAVLVCGQMVTQITPTHPTQKVYLNDPLITTAIATYRDGSTKVVLCTTSYVTNTVVSNKSVTITYTVTIGGITYTYNATLTVTVVPRSKTCSNGHTYNLRPDASDPGCPYCRAWLRSLSVVQPPSGSITIFKGTTLPENGIALLATYLDGHTEYLYSEYVDNLDKNYVGTQTVTLSYKGKYTSLTVVTKRNIILCPVCGRYYELYPDNTDPGCPYCKSKSPIFTGNVMEYYDKIFQADILKELYEGSGTYYFTNQDFLQVTVQNKSKSWGNRLLHSIFRGFGEVYLHIEYGGYIRETGYHG
jgi:Zn finger protein HypA/HybF involved in hydrogenase expression